MDEFLATRVNHPLWLSSYCWLQASTPHLCALALCSSVFAILAALLVPSFLLEVALTCYVCSAFVSVTAMAMRFYGWERTASYYRVKEASAQLTRISMALFCSATFYIFVELSSRASWLSVGIITITVGFVARCARESLNVPHSLVGCTGVKDAYKRYSCP
jgi:hypothetical protein